MAISHFVKRQTLNLRDQNMNEQNVIKFDEIAGKLLNYLSLSFPNPANIGPESLQLEISNKGDYDPASGRNKGEEPLTEDEKYLTSTIEWLYKSGYILATPSANYGRYEELVLAEKGLALLGIKPASLNAK